MMKRIVIKSKDNLIIQIQRQTRPVKVTQKEEHFIFRAQLKERIVPRCFRGKCRRSVQYKTKECNRYRQRKFVKKSKSIDKNNKKATTPIIFTLNDEQQDCLQYEDISSCTDDEIEILLKSTRKRMKDSDEEWQLLPKKQIPEHSIKLELLETKHAEVEYEFDLRQKLKRKEYLYKGEQNMRKKIKLEPIETNSGKHSDEEQNQELNAAYLKVITAPVKIKTEPLESNNNFIQNEQNDVPDEQIYEIHRVITKLETCDVDLSKLKPNNNDIKQELYSDL